MSEMIKVNCCGKEVQFEEYSLNHGMCDSCMDKGVSEANNRQVSQPLKQLLYWREYSDEMECTVISIVDKNNFENNSLDFDEDLNAFLVNHDIYELQEHVYESDKSHQELINIFHNNKTYSLSQSEMLREYLLDVGVLE